MKKFFAICCSALLLLGLLQAPEAVYADAASLVVDEADLLSPSEEADLEKLLREISDRYSVDVAVVTVYGIGNRDIQNFADDYFWFNGYGRGVNRDGILLVVDMEQRHYYECTSGFCIKAFTDYGLQYLEENFVSYLSYGQYYDAFRSYAVVSDSLLKQAAEGNPYDIWIPDDPFYGGDPRPEFKNTFEEFMYYYGDNLTIWGIISLVIGLIGSGISVGRMKRELTSVTPQSSANDYFSKGSFALNERTDEFLYRNTARTPIPHERDINPPTGGGGHYGGSTTHISSGGHSFGGHGGSF